MINLPLSRPGRAGPSSTSAGLSHDAAGLGLPGIHHWLVGRGAAHIELERDMDLQIRIDELYIALPPTHNCTLSLAAAKRIANQNTM